MGGVNPNRLTRADLARLLSCRESDAYAEADRQCYPYTLKHGVANDGRAITHRVYYRDVVLAFRDELGRQAARRAS